MNISPKKSFAVLLACCFAVPGCTPSRSSAFRSSFLPPSAASRSGSDAAYSLAEPPPVGPNLYYLKESPKFLVPAQEAPSKPTQLDSRIKRADERFQAGKMLYQAGDIEGARLEFDRAIDILLNAPDTGDDRQRLEKRLEQLADSIYRYDIEGLGSGENRDQVVYDKSPLDDILQMTFPMDPRLKNKVKDEIQATVSQLPLEMNDAVLSYVHYFSSERGRKILVSGLRRAGRYKSMISRVLDEEGVPQELIFLSQAESGFMPRAVSRKAATGMWQFVQWRGREYGLNQSAYHDDRLDPEQATRAAARHLRDLYTQFGDWYLAMAAYNCGPGCVDRAVQRTGYADFWELRARNALPQETCNYVPVIVAMTIVAKNAKDYDVVVTPDSPLEYDTIPLTAQTSLALVADAADRPVSEIKDMNPALLKNMAPAGYHLHLPKGTAPAVTASLQAIPESRRAAWRMHRVAPGETLAAIGKRYSTPVNLIASANTGTKAEIEAGDVLIIPASYSEPRPAVKRVATSRRGASGVRHGTTPVRRASASRPAAKPAVKKSAVQTASVHRKRSAVAR